jgi:hypothetical protein
MKKFHKVTTLAVAGAMSVGTAAAGASVAGAATRPKANTTTQCNKGSAGNLQVQREDTGKLSIDMGVDMARHVSGVPWKIRAYDNGKLIENATARTISDGSFSVTRLIAPLAGTNHVVFFATNLRTGETCRLNGAA